MTRRSIGRTTADVLDSLARFGPCSRSEIAEDVGISKDHVYTLLERQVRMGRVERAGYGKVHPRGGGAPWLWRITRQGCADLCAFMVKNPGALPMSTAGLTYFDGYRHGREDALTPRETT